MHLVSGGADHEGPRVGGDSVERIGGNEGASDGRGEGGERVPARGKHRGLDLEEPVDREIGQSIGMIDARRGEHFSERLSCSSGRP